MERAVRALQRKYELVIKIGQDIAGNPSEALRERHDAWFLIIPVS
jgi:hypothetical protein